jgi:hypothetical protein
LIYCLVATAYRAVQASSQVHKWHFPNAEDVFTRVGEQSARAQISLAADLFYSYGRNTKIADWKVAYMRAASEWFARALIVVLALAVAIAGYVVVGPDRPAEDPHANGVARPIQPGMLVAIDSLDVARESAHQPVAPVGLGDPDRSLQPLLVSRQLLGTAGSR